MGKHIDVLKEIFGRETVIFRKKHFVEKDLCSERNIIYAKKIFSKRKILQKNIYVLKGHFLKKKKKYRYFEKKIYIDVNRTFLKKY